MMRLDAPDMDLNGCDVAEMDTEEPSRGTIDRIPVV
jgi:hypothetical protein